MLQNEPTLAIAAVDTEENERLKFGVKYSAYSFHSLQVVQLSRERAAAKAAAQLELQRLAKEEEGFGDRRTGSVRFENRDRPNHSNL